ncbi:hypothetical protein JYJ95_22400 [Corallococcus exiguus]|uniref:hypothetical protein n=1 Tax=Corallococcus exiguus TaxID=83462 RepID=UPI001A8F7BCD|nr:hypothetical protein [Corallococcus exiguus]MBN8469261.1 hypothetical protein [Corallococcus exiguus]
MAEWEKQQLTKQQEHQRREMHQQEGKALMRRKLFKVLRRIAQGVLALAALVRIVDFLMDHWSELVGWLT